MIGTCDSCGRSDEDVAEVQRIYFTAAEPGEGSQSTPAEPSARVEVTEVEGVELWCAACRSTYPHLPLD